QSSAGPSGVCDQSMARIKEPASPPPSSQAGLSGAENCSLGLVMDLPPLLLFPLIVTRQAARAAAAQCRAGGARTQDRNRARCEMAVRNLPARCLEVNARLPRTRQPALAGNTAAGSRNVKYGLIIFDCCKFYKEAAGAFVPSPVSGVKRIAKREGGVGIILIPLLCVGARKCVDYGRSPAQGFVLFSGAALAARRTCGFTYSFPRGAWERRPGPLCGRCSYPITPGSTSRPAECGSP